MELHTIYAYIGRVWLAVVELITIQLLLCH